MAPLARAAALAGAAPAGPGPEGRVGPQSAEHLDVGGTVLQEGAGGVGAVDHGVDGATIGPAGDQGEQLASQCQLGRAWMGRMGALGGPLPGAKSGAARGVLGPA